VNSVPDPAALLDGMLAARLPQESRARLAQACEELAAGADPARFAALLSLCSRSVKRAPLAPSPEERARAAGLLPGWNPERWDVLDAARARVVLALPDAGGLGAELFVEEALRFADVGEAVALFRALPLLPAPARFAWHLGEGARSNMRALFEAAVCDSPFPVTHFDDTAWRSCVLKCLFVGAPLWRVWGLDRRLSPELAATALDFADERRSAGREVPHELWLCLGTHGGERARASRRLEQQRGNRRGRTAAALAAARAGDVDELRARAAAEADPTAAAILARAVSGSCASADFAALESLQH
jgi:hypothetical protein